MKSKSLVLSTGLAMFSMFFGSGNLVFPIVVGQMSQGHSMLGAIGILLTGVFVPFLGVFAMLLFNGSCESFFGRLGKYANFWFPLIALSLMGPFGVLARCITVAHGAFSLIYSSCPLWLFSIGSCLVIFLLGIRKSRIVPFIGSILTPFLLLSIGAICFFGLFSAPLPASSLDGSWPSLKNGILQGYQTMDLLAAFFFSAFVIKHLKEKESDSKKIVPTFLKASLIGGGLLSLIYFALVFLGSMYANELALVPPQEMLGKIAELCLGSYAAPIVCVAVIFACLTTAIVLTSLFADFLKTRVLKDQIPSSLSTIVTLGIAFFVSTLEFSGIARILCPILETIYPALIVLTILNIFHKTWGLLAVRVPIAIAFFAKLLSAI